MELEQAQLRLAAEIARRQQVEEALRESEARIRVICKAFPDRMFRIRRDGTLLEHITANSSQPGFGASELVGKKTTDLAPAELAQQGMFHIKRAFETGDIQIFEYQFPRDGERRTYEARIVVIDTGADEALVIIRDVTEHKQVKNELDQSRVHLKQLVTERASQQLIQSALDSLSANIAILDATGLILAVNASWRAFADENGLVGENYGLGTNYLAVADAVLGCSEEEAQEVTRGIRELISGQREKFSLEYPCHSPCEERWFIVNATRFQSSQGVGVAVSHENITARKRAGKQLEEAAAAAERQRLARELHDSVTQSLFLAASMAETLPRVWERNPDQASQAMAELRRLTHGALAEMRTMLLELRPTALTKQRLDLLLRQLTDGMMARTQMEVVMTLEGDCRLPDEVQISLYRITQEALNNVVKHSRADRAIVGLRCEPEQVVISVRDDGTGFDPHAVEPGSLGLGIMREWAQTIGAEFVLDSRPGRGTEITVTWENNSGTNEP